MSRSARFVVLAAAAIAAACVHRGAVVDAVWYPVPDVAPDSSSDVRGNAAAAGAISNDDQSEIVSQVLYTFYAPTDNAARWIDQRPLAHRRSADDTIGTDPDFAEDVVNRHRGPRTCVLEWRDFNCRGKAGGVVRFSYPYKVGKDSAIVFATYAPRDSSGKVRAAQSEMQFRLVFVRPDNFWMLAGKSTVSVFGSASKAPVVRPKSP